MLEFIQCFSNIQCFSKVLVIISFIRYNDKVHSLSKVFKNIIEENTQRRGRRSMKTIKAVIFDLDDTLYDFDTVHKEATKKLNQKAYELLGVDPALFDRIYHDAFRGVMQRMGTTVETGSSHSRTLRLQYTLEELGKPIFPNVLLLYDVYWGYILDHMQPEPYIKETVWERVEVEPMNVVVLNGEMQQAPKAAEKKPARGFFDRCEEIEDRAVCKKSDVKFYPDK